MLFFHSNIRAFTRIFIYTLSEKLPRENIRSWKVSKKSSKIPEFLFFFWFLKYRPFPCQLELSLWWNSNGMHFCILGRFILVSLSFRNLGGAKIIFFLFFYVNTYELTQTLHPFANIKYTLNLFLWNSLKLNEAGIKWYTVTLNNHRNHSNIHLSSIMLTTGIPITNVICKINMFVRALSLSIV